MATILLLMAKEKAMGLASGLRPLRAVGLGRKHSGESFSWTVRKALSIMQWRKGNDEPSEMLCVWGCWARERLRGRCRACGMQDSQFHPGIHLPPNPSIKELRNSFLLTHTYTLAFTLTNPFSQLGPNRSSHKCEV